MHDPVLCLDYGIYLKKEVALESVSLKLYKERSMAQSPLNPRQGPTPATPRWVKIFVAIFIILILVVIAVHLAGFNFGGHMP